MMRWYIAKAVCTVRLVFEVMLVPLLNFMLCLSVHVNSRSLGTGGEAATTSEATFATAALVWLT